MPLLNLGVLAFVTGDVARARELIDDALPILREAGDYGDVTSALTFLALVLLIQGDPAPARLYGAESLRMLRRAFSAERSITCLDVMAGIAHAEGHSDRAARIFAATAAARERLGENVSPGFLHVYDGILASLSATLGEAAFATAWTEGRVLSLDQAVALALEQIAPAAPDTMDQQGVASP